MMALAVDAKLQTPSTDPPPGANEGLIAQERVT